jgi:hypothetical protein
VCLVEGIRSFLQLSFLKALASLTAVSWMGILLLQPAGAQEIPRPSLVHQMRPAPPDNYNLRVGQVFLSADAGLTLEYNDNVYASDLRKEDDFVVRPEFGINAAWQVTQLNVLRLRTSLSYTKYLNHEDLDAENLNVSPTSALSFSVFVGDVRIELHDQFSLQNETIQDGTPGGVARLPRFTNTAGISVLWDMNDVIWSLGYDHFNFLTIGDAVSTNGTNTGDLSQLDHSTDQFSAAVMGKFNSTTTAGLEATFAISQYPDQPSSDFNSFSFGPFVEIQITRYSSIALNGGYKGYSFEQGPPSIVQLDQFGTVAVVPGREAGTRSGFYANVSINHRLNRYYSDHLEFGHEDQADALSGRRESNYIRYSSNWNVNSAFTLGFALSFEDVQSSTGSGVAGTLDDNYTLWAVQLRTGYKLTEHLNLSLGYQFAHKDSDAPGQGYTQNRVSLGLGYLF